VFPCSTPDACPGGNDCGPNRMPASENPLCGACLPGYEESGGECIACSETNGGAVFGLLILVLVLVQIFHFVSQGTSAYIGVLAYFVQTVILLIGSQTNAGLATVLSIFDLNIIAATSGSSCVISMSESSRVVSGFFGPLVAFGCWGVLTAFWLILPRYNRELARRFEPDMLHVESAMRRMSSTRTIATEQDEHTHPISCCKCLSASKQRDLLYMLNWCYMRPTSTKYRLQTEWRLHPVSRRRNVPSRYEVDTLTRWLHTLLSLFLLTFNGVTRTAFVVFNCIEISSGGQTLHVIESFPTVQCSGANYAGIVVLATIMLIMYLSVPVVIVCRYPHSLLPIRHVLGKTHRLSQTSTSSASVRYILAVLSGSYRNHAAWWKLWVLLRRLILVLVVVFAESRGWQMVGASIVSLLVALIHIMSQPYLHWVDNMMETVSLVALTTLAIVLVHIEPPYNDSDRLLLGTLWGLTFLLIFFWALIGWLMHRRAIKTVIFDVVRTRCNTLSAASLAKLDEQKARSEQCHTPLERHHTSSAASLYRQNSRASILIARSMSAREASSSALVDGPSIIELSAIASRDPAAAAPAAESVAAPAERAATATATAATAAVPVDAESDSSTTSTSSSNNRFDDSDCYSDNNYWSGPGESDSGPGPGPGETEEMIIRPGSVQGAGAGPGPCGAIPSSSADAITELAPVPDSSTTSSSPESHAESNSFVSALPMDVVTVDQTDLNAEQQQQQLQQQLPAGWQSYRDDETGHLYYHNDETGDTQWEIPH
jgi:WW domain